MDVQREVEMEEDFNEKPMDDNIYDDLSLIDYSPSRDLCSYAASFGYPSSMPSPPSSPQKWILSVEMDDGNANSSIFSLFHSPSPPLGWPCEKTFDPVREVEMEGDFNEKPMYDNMDLDAPLINYSPSRMVPSPKASMIADSHSTPGLRLSLSIFSNEIRISLYLSKSENIFFHVHSLTRFNIPDGASLHNAIYQYPKEEYSESLKEEFSEFVKEEYEFLKKWRFLKEQFLKDKYYNFLILKEQFLKDHYYNFLKEQYSNYYDGNAFDRRLSILSRAIITDLTVIEVSYTTVPMKLLTEKSLVKLRIILFSEGMDRKLMFLKLQNCMSLWVYDCHVKENLALPGFAPSKNSIVTKTEGGIHSVVSHPQNEGPRKTSKRKITLEDLPYLPGSLKEAGMKLGVSRSTIKRLCRDHGIIDWRNRIIDNKNQYLSKPKEKIESVQGEGAKMGNQIAGGSRPCEKELNHEQIGFPILSEKGLDMSQIGVGLIEESSTQMEITHAGDKFLSLTHEQCMVQLTELILSAVCLSPVAFNFTLLQTAERKLLIDHYYAAIEAFNTVVGVYLLELFVPPTITDGQEQEALFSSQWATMKQRFQRFYRNLLENENIYVKIITASADDQPDSRCKFNHVSQSTKSPPGPNGIPDGEEMLQQDSLRHQLVGETQSMNVGEDVLSEGGIYNAVSNPENEGTRKTSKRMCRNIKRKITLEDLQHFSGSHMDAAKRFEVSESTIKRLCRQHGIRKYQKIDKNNQSLSEPKDVIESVQGEGAEMGIEMAGRSRSCERELSHEQIDFLPESEKGSDKSQMGTVTMKATYREDLIRFQLSLTSGIIELRNVVAEKLMLEVGTFSIKYLDDDEDWILMTGDKDLQECFNISISLGCKFIKLLIHDIPAS